MLNGISYEDRFCKNSDQKGVAVLGDSISAHFHLPEEWFDATKIGADSFQNLDYFLENELDWPQLSAISGFMNSSWHVTQGPTRLINKSFENFTPYVFISLIQFNQYIIINVLFMIKIDLFT